MCMYINVRSNKILSDIISNSDRFLFSKIMYPSFKLDSFRLV